MFARIMKHEWRVLTDSRVLPIVVLLLLALTGYGYMNGKLWKENRSKAVLQKIEESESLIAKRKTETIQLEEGKAKSEELPNAASPRGFRYAVTLPPGPMSALSIGQSDMQPYSGNVSIYATKDSLFRDYELENPLHLLSGRFDFSFVLVYLFPLLILALSYNLLSAEKEQGTLPLALSQPIHLREFVFAKVLLRALVVLTIAVNLSLLAALFSSVDLGTYDGLVRTGLWLAVVVLYAFFWFGLALVINSFGRSSATNAAALSTLWLFLVMIVPSVLNLAISAVYPVPSRLEFIQQIREDDNETQKAGQKLLARYYFEHPELTPKNEKPDMDDFATRFYAVRKERGKRTLPTLNSYDEQLIKQQDMVKRYSILSPAIIMQETLNTIAGTSVDRFRHFQNLSLAYLKQWQDFFVPRIFQRQKLSSSEYSQIPRFKFQEESTSVVASRVLMNLILLILLASGIAITGWFRLQHYPLYD